MLRNLDGGFCDLWIWLLCLHYRLNTGTASVPPILQTCILQPQLDSTVLLGATNGLFQTGRLFGARCIEPFADMFSRRGAIAIASALSVTGGSLQASSQNIAMFLTVRTITCFGVGLAFDAIPLYQSELSPPHSRGFIVGAEYALAAWVGYKLAGNNQWRLPLALQVVAPASTFQRGPLAA